MFYVPAPDPLLDVPDHAQERGGGRTTTAQALLGILSLRPMSGYEIQRTIARTIGNFWQESFGQIYPALRKLVAGELAEVEERNDPGSGRVSKVYRLTDRGRARLREWLAAPCEPQVLRDELLLKTFFGRSAPAGAILSHLRAQRALLQADLDRYRATEVRLPAAQGGNPDVPFFLLTLRQGLAVAEAKLRWCDESIATLEALQPDASSGDGGQAIQTSKQAEEPQPATTG